MKILHRQILKEILSHALLGLVLFTFVLFVRNTTQLLEMALRQADVWGPVLSLTALTFPPLLSFSIPMAVVVGILVGLSRMSSDGEITAMRASGLSVRVLTLPVGLVALLGCATALYCSAFLSPRANRLRAQTEKEIGVRQISSDVQPRVFDERFPNMVMYVQDVVSGPQPLWRGIFLAELSSNAPPKITVAREGVLFTSPDQQQLQLHLVNGTTHEVGATPGEYSLVTFSQMDIPVQLPPPPAVNVKPDTERSNAELAAIPLSTPAGVEAHIELQRRFALPLAAVFLTLIAVPLGLISQKGGKSAGVILTLLVVVAYYSLLVGGSSLARQGWVPIWLGVWAANLLFGAGGLILLSRADQVTPLFSWLNRVEDAIQKVWTSPFWKRFRGPRRTARRGFSPLRNAGFPWILDRYVVRSFLLYLVIVVAALVLITEIVTFFLDLLNDVIRNQVPFGMVLDYFFYLAPQIIYMTTPLAVLVAILVSFAILSQNNEITAVKASGVSLFRLTTPLLFTAAALSIGLFLFNDYCVPGANRRQDAVRNQIKGRPAQTYLRPDQQWIVGEGPRIFYYSVFDPKERVLGGVTVLEFDPSTFQLTRRISAARARWEPAVSGWIFEDGWVRDLEPTAVRNFQQFPVRLFPEFHEPPSYFLKEVRQSSQMSFLELKGYVADLKQSGFDVTQLSVQLHKKFSFPLFAVIMALIGLPFAFSIGNRGALTGISLSLVIAIVFWSTNSLFEALGNLNELPPLAAAWSPDLLFGLSGLYLFLHIRT